MFVWQISIPTQQGPLPFVFNPKKETIAAAAQRFCVQYATVFGLTNDKELGQCVNQVGGFVNNYLQRPAEPVKTEKPAEATEVKQPAAAESSTDSAPAPVTETETPAVTEAVSEAVTEAVTEAVATESAPVESSSEATAN